MSQAPRAAALATLAAAAVLLVSCGGDGDRDLAPIGLTTPPTAPSQPAMSALLRRCLKQARSRPPAKRYEFAAACLERAGGIAARIPPRVAGTAQSPLYLACLSEAARGGSPLRKQREIQRCSEDYLQR